MNDPIIITQEHFDQLSAYRVTMHSSSAKGDDSTIHYSYRKPGYVRMDFIEPHRGAVLVYNPKTQKALLRPFGADVFPLLTLAPTNPLILSPSGHRVDQSDVGSLLRNVRRLQQEGGTLQQEDDTLDGLAVLHVTVTAAAGHHVDGIYRYQLWLERAHWFPVKIISHAEDGAVLETVLMKDVQFDVPLPDSFFEP